MPPSTLSPPPPKRQGSRSENNEETTNLPEDQVFEVLTRVPLDDLPACRVVSTRWRAVTYEPTFAPLHCRRTGAFSGYLVQSMTRYGHRADFVSAHHPPATTPPLSLDFVPRAGRPWRREDVRVVAVAPRMGLACCVSARTWNVPARYYVCKPATRQWLALPNPRLRFSTVATATATRRPSSAGDGRAVEFQIVRLSSYVRGNYDSMRCEVFDSRRFTWRRAADVRLPSISLCRGDPAVHAHGAAHWLRWPHHRDGSVEDVFALDVGTGVWRLIALPREVEDVTTRDPWSRKQITAVEGRLCLMMVTTTDVGGEEVLHVWEMASYANAKWEKKRRVSLKSLHEGEGRGVILQHLDSPDVVFFGACWYDLQRCNRIAQVQVNHAHPGEIFKFESDVIPCRTMGGRPCRSSSPYHPPGATPPMKVDVHLLSTAGTGD